MSFPALDALSVAAFATAFPLEDSQHFQDYQVDPTIRKETDGGLVFTRKRYTRPPARMIVTGFSNLDHHFKTLLDQMWIQYGGGSGSFYYVHPLDGTVLTMRFEDVWTTAYKGLGHYQVWDITNIKLRTV